MPQNSFCQGQKQLKMNTFNKKSNKNNDSSRPANSRSSSKEGRSSSARNTRGSEGPKKSHGSKDGFTKKDNDKPRFGRTDDKRSSGYKRDGDGADKKDFRSKDDFQKREYDKPRFTKSDDKRSSGYKRNDEGGESREKKAYGSKDDFQKRDYDKPRFTKSDDKRSSGYKRNDEGGESREKKAFGGKDDFQKRDYDKPRFAKSEDKRSGGYKRDGEGVDKKVFRDDFSGENKPRFTKGDNKRSDGYKREDERNEKKEFRGKNDFAGRDDEKRNYDKKPFEKGVGRSESGRPDRSMPRRDEKAGDRKGYDRKNESSDRDSDKKPFDKFRGKPRPAPKMNEKGEYQNRGYSKKKMLEFNKKQKTEGMIRLNKYIANSGICSRREADIHIEAGLVTVNGKPVTELGYQVAPGDVVKYNGGILRTEKNVYLLLNKPKDYITTMEDPGGRKTVMELIQHACRERIYPVGRLDRNTTGLLLFTNDGDLAKKLTHPKHGIKKIYHVETDAPVKKSDMDKMLKGLDLEDFSVKADEVSYVGEAKNEVGIMLHSGQNRVVRRMFEHFDYKVVKLDRVYFAGLTKKNIPRGKFRMLNDKEVAMLKMIP